MPAGSRHPAQIKGNTRNACHRIGLAHWTWTHTAISSNARKHTQIHLMLECSPLDEVVVAAASTLYAWRPTLDMLSVGLTRGGMMCLRVSSLPAASVDELASHP